MGGRHLWEGPRLATSGHEDAQTHEELHNHEEGHESQCTVLANGVVVDLCHGLFER